MNSVDKLIEELKKAKEELEKNVNMSYSGQPNGMSMGMGKGDGGQITSHVGPNYSKAKDMGNGRTVIGPSPTPEEEDRRVQAMLTAKAEEPTPEQEDKAMRAVAEKSDNDQAPMNDEKKKQMPMNPGKQMEKDEGEYFSLFKNGQWSLDKGDVIDMKSRKVLSSTPTKETPRQTEAHDETGVPEIQTTAAGQKHAIQQNKANGVFKPNPYHRSGPMADKKTAKK